MMNVHDVAYVRDGRSLRRVNSALDEPIEGVPRDVLTEDKMQIFYNDVNFMHTQDCALICQFYPYDYGQLGEALSGVSGAEYGIHDVLAIGARAQTLGRLFNLREGLTADDDRLPKRVMIAFESGPIEGSGISEEDFAWFKRRFYERMGWDAETGAPSDECLRGLGLDRLLR
jgi:aldehyde:ferredoxin oxidoreductase